MAFPSSLKGKLKMPGASSRPDPFDEEDMADGGADEDTENESESNPDSDYADMDDHELQSEYDDLCSEMKSRGMSLGSGGGKSSKPASKGKKFGTSSDQMDD